jgi:hypothetical protein
MDVNSLEKVRLIFSESLPTAWVVPWITSGFEPGAVCREEPGDPRLEGFGMSARPSGRTRTCTD